MVVLYDSRSEDWGRAVSLIVRLFCVLLGL